MVKIKVTRKWVKENYKKIRGISYCGAQWLLQYESAFAYSTRVEGWACDYYMVGDVVISTGYATIGEKEKYEVTKKYDDMARDIVCSDMDYSEKVREVRRLLNAYVGGEV